LVAGEKEGRGERSPVVSAIAMLPLPVEGGKRDFDSLKVTVLPAGLLPLVPLIVLKL
jgi:hypothetical protein